MEANKCFGRRRVEEECPRSASEKTSPLTARCAVSKGSARATASSAICAGKSITKSLPSAKRRSVKPPAKEATRTETQKPVICRIAGFLFAQNLSFRRGSASHSHVRLAFCFGSRTSVYAPLAKPRLPRSARSFTANHRGRICVAILCCAAATFGHVRLCTLPQAGLRFASGHVRLCTLPSQSRAFLALLADSDRKAGGVRFRADRLCAGSAAQCAVLQRNDTK